MSAPVRLLCLPYAGGSARRFLEWRPSLPDSVEVVPIELPGRGTRFNDGLHDRIEPLLAELLPAVLAHRSKPFALFGHSLGALLAYELCRRLERQGVFPRHLFVSAFRAPHLPARSVPDHDLPDEQFRERLRSFNGTPREVLEDEGLMELVVPILRADLAIADHYRHRPGPPLSSPITAFGGIDDREVPLPQVGDWHRHTTGEFLFKVLPGDHFFLHSHQDALLGEITERLTTLTKENA